MMTKLCPMVNVVILEAHARIPPTENGRLHGSRTMQEVP